MKFADVRKYVTGLLSASFVNKSILDNLAEDENENLTYKGAVIEGGGGGASTATEISYDDSTTAIGVNNVQSAIEYLVENNNSYGDISASQYGTFFDNIIVINNIAPFVMPAMTSDIYTDAEGFIFKTSASSVFSNSDVPNGKAYRPFDGTEAREVGDCWHPTSRSPQWLLLELPYLVSIKKFTLKNRELYEESPNYVIFQGSNDGKTFENIVDFYFPSGNNQSLTIETGTNNYYKYYRWYESSVHSYGVISKIIIDEAFMMEG